MDRVLVIAHQLRGDARRRERPLCDLGYRGNFGGGAGDEALGEAGQLLGHDAPLDHFEALRRASPITVGG